eukprot:4176900-Alexandrium_andersonii.AAC.1
MGCPHFSQTPTLKRSARPFGEALPAAPSSLALAPRPIITTCKVKMPDDGSNSPSGENWAGSQHPVGRRLRSRPRQRARAVLSKAR